MPVGLAPTTGKLGSVETRAFTCASCHFGKMPDGRYAVGDRLVDGSDSLSLTEALREAKKDQPDPIVIIYADAMAAHQSVMTAMQAARTAGIGKVHFATQAGD